MRTVRLADAALAKPQAAVDVCGFGASPRIGIRLGFIPDRTPLLRPIIYVMYNSTPKTRILGLIHQSAAFRGNSASFARSARFQPLKWNRPRRRTVSLTDLGLPPASTGADFVLPGRSQDHSAVRNPTTPVAPPKPAAITRLRRIGREPGVCSIRPALVRRGCVVFTFPGTVPRW